MDKENEVPNMDADSVDFSEDFDVYRNAAEFRVIQLSGRLVKICLERWRSDCTDRPEFLQLDDKGRQGLSFFALSMIYYLKVTFLLSRGSTTTTSARKCNAV